MDVSVRKRPSPPFGMPNKLLAPLPSPGFSRSGLVQFVSIKFLALTTHLTLDFLNPLDQISLLDTRSRFGTRGTLLSDTRIW